MIAMSKAVRGAVHISIGDGRDSHQAYAPTAHSVVDDLQERRAKLSSDRRLNILNVARDVFVEEGFAASSMSNIASRLGGSKGTLYAYFSSKEALFAEVVAHECSRKIAVIFGSDWPSDRDAAVTMRNFGKRFVRLIFSEETMQFTRMVIAEASRRPELGVLFYEAGPRQSRQRLASYLAGQVAAGHLPPLPVERVARQFCDLCLSDLYTMRLMNIVPPPREDQIDDLVESALTVVAAVFGIAFSDK